MPVNKYVKKPVVISAIQLTEASFVYCLRFIGKDYFSAEEQHETFIYMKTLEGEMIASKGDYIIRGIQGEFYPCKESIFLASYEAYND